MLLQNQCFNRCLGIFILLFGAAHWSRVPRLTDTRW